MHALINSPLEALQAHAYMGMHMDADGLIEAAMDSSSSMHACHIPNIIQ